MTVIRENYPCIVALNFKVEAAIDYVYERGYFIQSLFFPLMLVGIIFWSIYFTYEAKAIELEYGYDYLVAL